MPTIGAVLENNISHNNKTKYQFSCLTAVQHWYDGSTTGQNENYGIMLQYADSTIADYNSFYSADCTDATLRPSMTISYTPGNSSYSVNEGETLALPITRAAGVVTWVSSDSTIATVNSNGVVTGIKAGEVTITAFSNGTEYHSYTVYVTVVNGVYRIRYGSSFYLGSSGGVVNNTSVKLMAYASSGVDLLRQLWKITYLGDGYYSIRPLHKLNMGLHAGGNAGTSADIVTMGMSDTLMGVLLINRWGITKNDDADAYYLNHVGTSSLGLKPNGYTPAIGMDLTIAQNPGDDVFDWSLQRVTGVFLHDTSGDPLDITDTIYAEVEMGGTYRTSLMGFFVTTSNVALTWSSDTTKIAVDQGGKVTANKRGIAEITASGTSGGNQYSFEVNVTSIETVYVKNLYDKTYSGNTEKINEIYNAVSFLNLVYYEEFQLRYVMDGAPVQYTADGVDRCPLGTDPCDEYCKMPCEEVCGETCTEACKVPGWAHHKNISRIYQRLYQEFFEPNHIVVLWSDSPASSFCNAGYHMENGQAVLAHDLINALAATPYGDFEQEHHLPVIIVFQNAQNQNDWEAFMSINLAHEVAHTLDLKEIYDNDYNDNVTTNSKYYPHDTDPDQDSFRCIMQLYSNYRQGALHNNVRAGVESALCDYCIEKLHTVALKDDVYES